MARTTIAILAAVLALAVPSRAQVSAVETGGNLAPTHTLDCISIDQIKNIYTPADLLAARTKCYAAGRFEDGFILWRMAAAYAQYDKWRVSDVTARDAFRAMLLADSRNDETTRQINLLATKYMAAGPTPEKSRFCEAIRRLGPPDYYPAYMVRHGLHAFTGAGGNGLVADFDGAKVWQEVLQYYLRCDPGDGK